MIKTKSSYWFEDHGTDRRNRFRNVLSKTFLMIPMTRLPKLKINWRQVINRDRKVIPWVYPASVCHVHECRRNKLLCNGSRCLKKGKNTTEYFLIFKPTRAAKRRPLKWCDKCLFFESNFVDFGQDFFFYV